jgi:hypothetical protein
VEGGERRRLQERRLTGARAVDFISLVNEVARESGTMGSQRLTSVVGASGRWLKIIAWTRQAWEMIQRDRPDWIFREREFTHALVVDQARYDAQADFLITDFGGWAAQTEDYTPFSIYDPAIGRGDETPIRLVTYRAWKDQYDRGVVDSNRPQHITVDGDRKLCFGPEPDKAYVLRGTYRRALQSLAADADTPFISADHHATIVWRALMLLGDDDEAPFEVGSSTAQFRACRSAMLRDYTESVSL